MQRPGRLRLSSCLSYFKISDTDIISSSYDTHQTQNLLKCQARPSMSQTPDAVRVKHEMPASTNGLADRACEIPPVSALMASTRPNQPNPSTMVIC